MSFKPCDQFAADTLEVQRQVAKESGVPLSLSVTTVEHMVGQAEEAYAGGTFESFAEVLEVVLWKHEFLHDIEHTAYRKVLETVFKRRAKYKQQEDSRRGKYAKFAPR